MPAPGAVAAKDAETRRKEYHEKVRSNKERERLERGKFKAGPISGNLEAFWKPGRLSGLDFSSNDPSWYNTIPELVRDVANVSFMSPAGTRGINTDRGNLSIPGIQTIKYIPTYGPYYSDSVLGGGSNALEVAAQKIYVEIRSKNSGAINYAPVDVLLVLLAFDSLFTTFAKLRRIYACLSNYSAKNLYLGKYLTKTLGFTIDDVEAWTLQLAEFRYKYNVLVTKANTIRIPVGIPMYSRHAWLESNIFKDTDVDNAQLTAFVCKGFYKYVDSAGPANLNAVEYVDYADSILGLFNQCEDMIDEILVNTDIGIISGDIYKAFGDNGMMQINMVEEVVPIPIIYSPEVNNQIDNATIHPVVGYDASVGRLGVYQLDTGKLFFGYDTDYTSDTHAIGPKALYYLEVAPNTVDIGTFIHSQQILLNSYDKSNPSNDDVMVYSRLMAMEGYTMYKRKVNPNASISAVVRDMEVYGTEIVTEVAFWELVTNEGQTEIRASYIDPVITTASESSLSNDVVGALVRNQAAASIFFHHPKFRTAPIVVILQSGSETTSQITDPMVLMNAAIPQGVSYATMLPVANVDQVAYVDKYVLSRLHEVAILSLLGLSLKSRV